MKDFLIISTICLFAFLAVYHLFLEREKMHRFNRFYLLFSIAFSFVIPFLSIPIPNREASGLIGILGKTLNPVILTPAFKTDYFLTIVLVIYMTITSFLLLRFLVNLLKIRNKIVSNLTQSYQSATLVLTEEKILPHTFLHYIFVNSEDHDSRNIEKEIYTHELTHVLQKHTLDVLGIEFLKTIFWFNPIFILYKKAIQLNHEFLADEKVVISHKNVPLYQRMLVSMVSVNSPYYLASNLNYLVTKKRLIMMTKNTSQTKAMFKKLALIPVFAIAALVSCNQDTESTSAAKEKPTTKKIETAAIGKEENLLEPSFPGGLPEFYKFIAQNFKIPEGYKGEEKLMVSFLVEKDGSITNIDVLKDLGNGTKEEAIRVLKSCPKWIPATVNNEVVKYQYVVPISLVSK